MGVVNNNNRLQTNPANPNKTISRLDKDGVGGVGVMMNAKSGVRPSSANLN